MNRKLLILLALPLLMASERIAGESPQPRTSIEVPVVDHELERMKIEANCYANETSKSKQEFLIFADNMTAEEIEAAKRLIE